MIKVLWLASWYPNDNEPVNGDFVQRHAKAVAEFMPVDIIHVPQLGKDAKSENKKDVNKIGALTEYICYFSYKLKGIGWLDKILYNIQFQHYYFSVLQNYFHENGYPDLIHVHVPVKAGIIGRKISLKHKIPYIVSEHSSLYLKTAEDNFYKRSFFFQYHTRKIFRDAAKVTNVSAAIGKVIKQMFGLKEVITIYNVVNTSYFNFKSKEKDLIFRWLHVSSLVPLKNPDKILHAFHALNLIRNDWELIICGPAPIYLPELAEALHLQHKISFTGELPYEQIAEQMQLADGLVLFSMHENFPCVIAEALCCGLPVVSSNVGGVSEAVNESNGILVEPSNLQEVTKALARLMDTVSSYDRKEISNQAVKKYSLNIIAKQFINLYKDVKSIKTTHRY